ncbi:MAG TPA: hypothetical protein V6D22_01920 [Candidatus Obscuribacterales bacterium]
MSLFLFQQKIPFRSVSTFLRVFEPGSQMSPDQFAKAAVEDVTAGDLLFVLEPIYSPWSDSSSGIGVAEGDAFNVAAIIIGYKWENGLLGYVVNEESYERQNVQNYLAQQAHTAKSSRCGFYYAIVRPVTPLSPDVMRDLAELDSFGNSGFRKDENQPIDILYGFATAAGLAMEVQVGQQPDIAQIGYGLFCDKEPAQGSNVPDFRGLVEPIAKDQKREPEQVPADLSQPEPVASAVVEKAASPVSPPAAPAQPPKIGLPKMPSFFNKGKQQQQQDGKSKTPRIIGPAPRNASQLQATSSGEQQSAAAASAPLPEPGGTPPAQGFDPLSAWAESSDTEQTPALTTDDLSAVEGGAPPLPDARGDQAHAEATRADEGNHDLASSMQTANQPPPLPQGGPPPLPITPPPLPANGGRVPGVRLPRSSGSAAMPAGLQPPPLPAGEAPNTVAAEKSDSGAPQPQSWSEPQSAQPGAAVDNEIPSLAELLGNISRASQQQEPPPAAPPSLSEPAATEDAAAGGEGTEASPAPGASAAKKKPDPAHELQNRPIKEPITVKSGVAGLVSKLEQQASKASNRLETQVDEIQNRLTEEISELLAKVNSAESRSVRNGQDLRAELSESMDKATFDISEKIAVAAKDGAHTIKQHDDQGSSSLNEKYDYLRTALTNSFEEVKARAEAIAKDFEETLGTASERSLKDLDQLKQQVDQQLTDLYAHYEKALQDSFDAFEKRLQSANSSVSSTLEARYQLLQGQLQDAFGRSSSRLEQWQYAFVNQLNKEFTVARSDLRKLRANTMAQTILPRLQEHREQLRAIISECQSKLAEDLEKKADEKLSSFEPMLVEKRQRLQEMLHGTAAVKDSIAEQLRERLQKIGDELKAFVEQGIGQAQTAFKTTEDQLAEIDRAVRQLADQSSIEGDLELLNERNQVLSSMDEANEKAKDEVLSTLRTSLAVLEEKGKQLQEELISSMEEDAYRVRRASEQSLNTIRDAIKDAFQAIQSAQDERMPM